MALRYFTDPPPSLGMVRDSLEPGACFDSLNLTRMRMGNTPPVSDTVNDFQYMGCTLAALVSEPVMSA